MMSQPPTMLFIGMDVHKDSTVFCIFDPSLPEKNRYRHVTVPTNQPGLESVLKPLGGRCKVAFEVGTQAQWVAQVVRPWATQVQVANPSMMPWLFRDGRKNDKMDSKKLATLLYLDQLPQVHLPHFEVSVWRALINHRRSLIKHRTMIKNQIRALLRAQALRCPHKSLWTRKGQLWLASLEFHVGHKLMLDSLAAGLLSIDDQRVKIEQQLDAIARTQPAIPLLRTIPGIGPRSAEAIVAYADDIRRFTDKKKFASYFGMTPTQDSSGLRDRHGHISKRGPSVVRWVLVEALHHTVRRSNVFRAYFERIRRGKKDRYKKAIVATGRKLLTIAFAMLRDNCPFDPARVHVAAA
jgi:transposase